MEQEPTPRPAHAHTNKLPNNLLVSVYKMSCFYIDSNLVFANFLWPFWLWQIHNVIPKYNFLLSPIDSFPVRYNFILGVIYLQIRATEFYTLTDTSLKIIILFHTFCDSKEKTQSSWLSRVFVCESITKSGFILSKDERKLSQKWILWLNTSVWGAWVSSPAIVCSLWSHHRWPIPIPWHCLQEHKP